jgi:hypothetical protein
MIVSIVTIPLLAWIAHHQYHYYDYSYEDGTVRVVYVDNVDDRNNLFPCHTSINRSNRVTAVVRRTPMTGMTGDGTITATTMGRTVMMVMMIIISIISLVGTSRTNHTTIIRIRRRKWPLPRCESLFLHPDDRVGPDGCWYSESAGIYCYLRYILLVVCCFMVK